MGNISKIDGKNVAQRHRASSKTGIDSSTTTTTSKSRKSQPQKKQSKDDESVLKKKTEKRQRMVHQIVEQNRVEREQLELIQSYGKGALKDLAFKYVHAGILILTIGLGLVTYFAPNTVAKFYRRWRAEARHLPKRTIMTIYPGHLNVREALPRYYQKYALATPENASERRAMRHAQALKRMAAAAPYRGLYQQVINLIPWEMQDFTKQMKTTAAMDNLCGEGFGQAFEGGDEHKRADLIYWCLMARGHHDGYLHFNVQRLDVPLTRRLSGVAIQRYYDSGDNDNDSSSKPNPKPRVHSTSLLLLPLHDPHLLAEGQALPPTTVLPWQVLAWITKQGVHMIDPSTYRQALEEFIYQAVMGENQTPLPTTALAKEYKTRASPSSSSITPRWTLWWAACTPSHRDELEGRHRRVGTTCPDNDDNANDEDGTPEHGNECCTFYNPQFPSLWGGPQKKEKREEEEDASSSSLHGNDATDEDKPNNGEASS